MIANSIAVPILESSQVGEARRKAYALASNLGFSELERGNIGIVVTELANNLARHARNGLLILRPITKSGVAGIEILSLDQGPGMSNISECLRDGFSTAGTPGNGLGAIARLSNFFEIYSVPEQGTAILCHIWTSSLPENQEQGLETGVVCLPKQGEEVSGDAWDIQSSGDRHLIVVADGLGHGHLAAQASQEAVRIFREQAERPVTEIMAAMHAGLRSTRGAAVAIAEINFHRRNVQYTGVGNICGSILATARNANMVSYNGTIGYEARKIQEFNYQWFPDALLIMHSDGLGTQWRLDRYPGLVNFHPSLIAGILYRDYHRVRDDVTVLVVRQVN